MDEKTSSHEQIHKEWSRQQLKQFRSLSPTDRLLAVNTRALDHWTTRDQEDVSTPE